MTHTLANTERGAHGRPAQGEAWTQPLRVFLLSNIPTPNNDALFAHIAAQPGVILRVAYCAEREPNRAWDLAGPKDYDSVVLPGRSLGGWVHVNPSILRALGEFRPHVVVLTGSYYMPTLHVAAAWLGARGIPWVYWGEELQHGGTSLARRLGRALLRWPIRAGRGVLAIGARARRSYERAGVESAAIASFLYYADASSFRTAGEAGATHRAAVRARLGIAGEEPLFLLCGQLIHRKGVDTFLEAMAHVVRRGLPGVGVLVGEGPERERYEALARRLGIDDRTRFVGFVQPPRLPEWFAAADVLVLPSRFEGWGLVVSEAFAAGLPVVATAAVNAAVELVDEGQTGWIVPVDDPKALGDALGVIAADPALLGPARAAVREASARLDPAVAAPRFVSILRAVLDGTEIRAC